MKIHNVSKKYGDIVVFKSFSINFENNKIYSVLGPSGCGKTTMLNIISGLVKYGEGSVIIDDCKDIAYVMQNDHLLPWRTLRENISLGIEVLNDDLEIDYDLIDKYIYEYGLSGFEGSYPEVLSGGMRKRASIIRALVCKPDIFLLDEPFSNLDYDIKLKIQKNLLEYYYENKSTFVLVTHDIEDAIALSDKVYILSDKPCIIKKNIEIDLGYKEKDPVRARRSEKFSDYFALIWDELKYLE